MSKIPIKNNIVFPHSYRISTIKVELQQYKFSMQKHTTVPVNKLLRARYYTGIANRKLYICLCFVHNVAKYVQVQAKKYSDLATGAKMLL